MSSDRTDELVPPGSRQGHAAVSVTVDQVDLLGLQGLVAAAGVGVGARSFAELLTSTLHRGLIESYKAAGLAWPPNPAAVQAEKGFARFGEPRADEALRRPPRSLNRRGVALGAAAVATLVVIVGSYAGNWSWTGLRKNGQVWDWLQLLLLPVALGTFPLWLRYSGEMSSARRKALGGAVLGFAAFVLAGYVIPLVWTGFQGKKLWDWLILIVLPVTIATATVWPKTGRAFRPFYAVAAAVLGVMWIVTIIGGYAGGWTWTGYPGNTLWDWVKLLLAPLAITTFVVPELIRIVSGHDPDDSYKPAAENLFQGP